MKNTIRIIFAIALSLGILLSAGCTVRYVEVDRIVKIDVPSDFFQDTPVPKKSAGWTEVDSQGDDLGPYIGAHKQAIKTGNSKLHNIEKIVTEFNKKADEFNKKQKQK